MNFKLNSLRSQLILMIALVSSIGIVSSLYLINLNFEKNKTIIENLTRELVSQEFASLKERHVSLLSEFGIRVQQNQDFKNGVRNKNKKIIESYINSEFHQYYVTANILDINKIYTFDKKYNLLGESSEGNAFESPMPLCSQLVKVAKLRVKSDRNRTISTLCYYKNHAFNSVIVPIGTVVPIGYLQVISTPFNIFKIAESKLGMPLRIETISSQVSYQSKNWVADNIKQMVITHEIPDILGKQAVSILMKKDISETYETFSASRSSLILFIGFVTLLAIALFYYRLEKSMLKPLNILEKRLLDMDADRSLLGKPITPEGFPEIQSLTYKFNLLSNTLSGLYLSLENLAYRDPLTSLSNRSKLIDILNVYTKLNKENDTPFCLIIFDINHFKSVNDTMGHYAGDLLLQQLSARLTLVLRNNEDLITQDKQEALLQSTDNLFRMGGDEFAFVIPSTSNRDTIISIVNDITSSLSDSFIINNFSFNLNASLGLVMCPEHGNTTRTLMQHADTAMYSAKERNLDYVIYEPEMDEHSISFLDMDTELRSALKNNKLRLAFQPKIDFTNGKIVAVEALLRWTNKAQEFVSPEKFIKVAEQSGLINDITFWVIQAAFKQKYAWQQANINISMSINLSAKNLFDKSLISRIRDELKKYSILPQTIVLELTETAVMSDPEYALVILQQLSDLGLKLSIDDFGTGYSSLSYLKQFPVDEIKIDQSFVRDLESNENDLVIVRSTIDLAHNMGMKVVAEGVETSSVYAKLKEQNCDLAQGYYMAKPMYNDEFEEWLKNSVWGLNPKLK